MFRRLPAYVIILTLCISAASAQKIRSYPDKASAHILKIEKITRDNQLPVIGNEPDSPSAASPLLNPAKKYKAYVLCVLERPEYSICAGRLYFANIKTGETFMITDEVDLAERNRPISDFKWLDNNWLSYERWMNPHFGRRYVVNVKLQKQTAAFVLTDQR